jgi:hypothetical protein
MYETFIKINSRPEFFHQIIFQTIKTKVYATIEQLKKTGEVEWYSFLIHGRLSGVPTTIDDNNAYFHIRFSLSKEADEKEVLKSLPDFCVMTKKVNPASVESISVTSTMMYNPSLRKHEGIEEVWRIIGEQTELLLKVFDSYKDDAVIPLDEINSFLHYFHNMVQFSAYRCSNCGSIIQI